MRTISGSRKQWIRRRFVWAVALLGVILLAVVLAWSPLSAAATGQQEPMATPVSGDGALVYLEADSYGRPRAIVKKPRDDLDALPAREDTSSVLATTNIPGRCEISGLHAAPRGQWVAVQVNCEDGGFVQVVHAASGQAHSLDCAADACLLDVLRAQGYQGVKAGCHEGVCGACTVLVDGQAVYACMTMAGQVQGRHITTIEGLGSLDRPHPLQQA
ncbi:MAG: 2Fe-2S iron-sulfur cluster binding domain-containing protein, partial [Chloroflexi bacterium]|nr:2Fe-2S iron-sulfur cluster binding domain-containing protein [Chloroflexota bacterium]